MEYNKIVYEVNEKIACIKLNSPKNLNAFDEDMLDELVMAFRCAEEDIQVKVVVLSGVGKAFSAGGDIGYMYKEIKNGTLNMDVAVSKMANVALAIKKLSKPVIAAVKGAVAGAGFNTALACDFCFAADSAMFMQAFVNIGLIPDAGGLYLLTRAVGVNRALDYCMTGRPIMVQEAVKAGFVKEVYKEEELEAEVMKFAKKLSNGPSLSYSNIKKLAYESEYIEFERFIKAEVTAQTECSKTEDFKEGVNAFVEKRKANFK